MPLEIDPSRFGQEFARTTTGPVQAADMIAFARALGGTRPQHVDPAAAERGELEGVPTYCLRFHGERVFPEGLPASIGLARGLDAGKDIEFGVPIRPGDSITCAAALHEVYEKTGSSGLMIFVVVRFTMTNQRGELVAVIDNRFMCR